jgi:hypothetical protein
MVSIKHMKNNSSKCTNVGSTTRCLYYRERYCCCSSYVEFASEVKDCLQRYNLKTVQQRLGINYIQRTEIIHHVRNSLWYMIIHVVVNLAS